MHRLATRERMAITPRAMGSGLSGGAVPLDGSIVIGVMRMNRILEIDEVDRVAVVQAGVINARLQAEVETRGLFYPPDPSSLKQSAIGGNVAENAGGARCLKYGVTGDYVMALEVVLPNGDGDPHRRQDGQERHRLRSARAVHRRRGDARDDHRDHPATLTEAEVRAHRHCLVRAHRGCGPNGHGGHGERLAPNLHRVDGPVDDALHRGERADRAPARRRRALVVRSRRQPRIRRRERTRGDRHNRSRAWRTLDSRGRDRRRKPKRLWNARRSISPALARRRPNKLGEDVCRSALARSWRWFARLREIAAKHALEIPLFGHAGDGNLHPNILCDRRDAEEMARVKLAAREIFEAAVALGGTLSGEHGIGLLKKQFMELDVGAETLAVMRAIKDAIDPLGIMNPGKIFPDPGGIDAFRL